VMEIAEAKSEMKAEEPLTGQRFGVRGEAT
jgi:hypothetical protein